MTEARLNPPPDSLNQADFLTQFGGIYEHSPWVAEQLRDEGLGPQDAVVSHFATRKLALLRAHPELAGKLAVAGGLTAESTAEQAGAGLDRCSPAEFAAFTDLNTRYGARFGHPFIIAVRGLDRAAILAAFTARVENDPATEFATALAEVHKSARLRLELLADQR